MSGSEIHALDASASFLIAIIGVSVALALAAVGESPETGLALVALSSVDAQLAALALARLQVAVVVQRAHRVALARQTSLRPETVRRRRTPVAPTPHHVRLALALTTHRRADSTLRPSHIAITLSTSIHTLHA